MALGSARAASEGSALTATVLSLNAHGKGFKSPQGMPFVPAAG